jgi:hypothetical protein
MSKELDTVEINTEIIADLMEQPVTQLNELSLACIGGGVVTVSF